MAQTHTAGSSAGSVHTITTGQYPTWKAAEIFKYEIKISLVLTTISQIPQETYSGSPLDRHSKN